MRPSGRTQSRYVLANQILAFVRDERIGRDRHLVETALAERLGVSRTLVRAALKLLAARGIAEPRPNQGFFLVKPWSDLTDQVVEIPPTLEEDTYRRLVRDRIDGVLPERITQVALIERYRIDRSVLLRALARMADEGIVAKNKGHGWTFLPSIDTVTALRASYDFRRAIEPAGLLLPTFQIDSALLDKSRSAHRALLAEAETVSGQGLYALDVEFHEMLAGFTQNGFFLQAIQQQNRMRRLLEYKGYADRRRVRDWVKEHLAIMDALRAGKIEAAAEHLAAHLDRAFRATQKRTTPPRRAAALSSPIRAAE